MADRAVLDSGVIFAIYFEEEASERAAKAAGGCSAITLDLDVAEVGNAAWKRVAFFQERDDAASLSFSKCLQFIDSCQVIRSAHLAAQAFEISLETKATFYDSLFLAASEQEKVPLITLDRKMYELAKAKYNVQML